MKNIASIYPIKLRKPIHCVGCRWYTLFNSTSGYCLHGLPTQKINPVPWYRYSYHEDIFVNIAPIWKCPKPRTVQESIYFKSYLDKIMKYLNPLNRNNGNQTK